MHANSLRARPPHAMNNAVKFLLVLIVGLAVVVVGLFANNMRRQSAVKAETAKEEAMRKGVDEANQRLNAAADKHPEQMRSEAMANEANRMLNEKLSGNASQQQKLANAAGAFMGFYLINTRSRVDFCNDQGVNISSFANAITSAHTRELAKAREIMTNVAKVDDDQIYAKMGSQLRPMVLQDMQDLATAQKLNLKQACQLFADNGPAIAAEMNIRKTQPLVASMLN